MIRAYLRVSADGQTVKSQKHSLKTWLSVNAASGDVKWYEDAGYTGGNQERPGLQQLMTDARSGDTALCFALDRMTREGIAPALELWKSLRSRGVKLVSVSEPWLDDTNPCADLILAVLSWAAEQERKRIHRRQREGIARVRAENGGRCPWGGRAKGTRITLTEQKEKQARKMKREGETVADIARVLGLARKTVYVALARGE